MKYIKATNETRFEILPYQKLENLSSYLCIQDHAHQKW